MQCRYCDAPVAQEGHACFACAAAKAREWAAAKMADTGKKGKK